MKRSAAFSKSETIDARQKYEKQIINNYMSQRFDQGSGNQIEEETDQNQSQLSSEESDQKNFFIG